LADLPRRALLNAPSVVDRYLQRCWQPNHKALPQAVHFVAPVQISPPQW
jgi:hypothetical protein